MAEQRKQKAVYLVILLGFVSLFADVTYEGAKSITGQYLAILGATGAIVGIVAGLGELVGYAFRIISGYFSDKTGRYWLITIIGYIINLLAVPLLSLAGNWPLASVLMIIERFGKSIRTPSRDAMLSYAAKETGRGWGFGLHEALDQIGAILGPLIVSLILFTGGTFQFAFAFLLIPACFSLFFLTAARLKYPQPENLEIEARAPAFEGFPKKYWLYVVAVSLIGAGYVDFALMAFHFEKSGIISTAMVPIYFSIAMAADGISALIFGKVYDIKGITAFIFSTILASSFALLVFIPNPSLSLIGLILWGIGLGAQESIMRAIVASLVPANRRATAYGTMNFWFGISWFLGSVAMGLLYDVNVLFLISFSFLIQILAIPFLYLVKKTN